MLVQITCTVLFPVSLLLCNQPMSTIRIALGVIAGGGVLAGVLAAMVRFPRAAMFLMFGAAGVAILAVAYYAVRTGIVGAKRSKYERTAHPVAFWFFVTFYTFIGLVVLGYAVCCLLYPEVARR
jgi:hypothetical protein